MNDRCYSLPITSHSISIPHALFPTIRCHPGDDEGHTRGSETCGVVINEMCAKGHTSKRGCRDPAGLPCQPCERERLAAEREAEEQENTRRRREEDREKAAARLAAARRAAANEREKLSHGLELLRLERETQRAEVDAEEARASAGAAQARLTGIRTRGDEQVDPAADRNAGGQPTSGVREDIERNAKRREDELNARFVETGKAGAENRTSTRKAGVEARVGNDNNISKKRKGRNDARTRRKPAEVENQANSCSAADGLPASTLRLVAQAAENGDADGILKALEAVPKAEWERASHELALAVGDTALAWFPLSYGGGREPQLVSAPTGRTAQAMKMMSQGQWVGARRVLAAALKEDEGNTQPPAGSVNPHIIFALALCDFNLGGAATAPQLLRKLQAAELEIWPGSTEGAACPGARAFPLAALVRATLVTAVFEDTNVPNGSPGTFSDAPADENGELDPRVQACSSAIAFMRASAHARQSGGIDGRIWEQAAEMVVRKTGGALAVALWGPEGGGGTGTVDGDDRKEALGERVATEWKKLKAQWGVTSSAMEELLDMSGLDTIKLRFLNIAQSAALDKERGYDLAERSYNIRLEGNPGTGAVSVARSIESICHQGGDGGGLKNEIGERHPCQCCRGSWYQA